RLREHGRRLDVHRRAVLVGDLVLLVVAYQPKPRELEEACHRDIALDVLDEVEAVLLAVLCRVGDAVVDGLGYGAGVDLLAALEHTTADLRSVGATEETHRELGAASAHQPGDTDDLAGPHVEVDAIDDDTARVLRVVSSPVLDAQQLLADIRRVV